MEWYTPLLLARRIGWRPSGLSGARSAAVAPVVAAVTIMIVVVPAVAVAPIIVIPITIMPIVVVAVVPHLLRRSSARGKRRGGKASFHRL
jgi:hypothetical protein